MKIAFVVSTFEHTLMNLGLGYIISVLKKKLNPQIEVFSIDLNSNNLESNVVKKAQKFSPDVICFSANSLTIGVFLRVAYSMKTKYPNSKIVFGGVHPTIAPEKLIELNCVDAVCIGEGEYALIDYVRSLEVNKSSKIDNIWYKDENNEIIKCENAKFIKNLDDLPFPDKEYLNIELKDFLNYNFNLPGHLPYLASRGCPLDCAFCSSPAIQDSCNKGDYYRLRSPESVIAEIKDDWEKYKDIGFKSLHFYDPIFGLDNAHFRKLCNLLIKEKLNTKLKWECSTRPEVVTEEWAKLASEAGCRIVSLGIESGDDYIRGNVYGKDFSKRDIIKATENLKKFNIASLHNYIIGPNWDNYKTVNNTKDIINVTNPTFEKHSYYYPIPRTKILDEIFDKKDFKWEEKFFYKENVKNDSTFDFPNESLQPKEIVLMVKKLRRKAENRYFKNIIKFFKIKDLLYLIRTLYHHIFVVKDIPFYYFFFKSSILYSMVMEKLIEEKDLEVSDFI